MLTKREEAIVRTTLGAYRYQAGLIQKPGGNDPHGALEADDKVEIQDIVSGRVAQDAARAAA